MEPIRVLLKKNQGIVQFVKFGLVGVTNTAVDWIAFFLLSSFIFTTKEGELVAKPIAFLIAMANSFLWNTVWTFKKEYREVLGNSNNRFKTGATIFMRYVIISLSGWGINFLSFKYSRFNLNYGEIAALVIASAAATLWNFFANKLWTYRK